MAKFYGNIGYAVRGENPDKPGIHTETIIEKTYRGDVLTSNRRMDDEESINPDIVVSNKISIISNAYALNNIYAMRYVIFQGTKWKVRKVEVKHPRLIISLGDIYTKNGGE